jgi:hypothetical protein
VVNGFNSNGVNQDLIQLSSSIVHGFADLSFRQSGSDTLLTIDAGDSIRLSGVTASTFNAADVKFV